MIRTRPSRCAWAAVASLARGLGVALGLEQVALQARVGDEDDAGEGDDRGADGCHQVDEDRGGARERECVAESSGRQAGGELAVDPHALAATHVRRDEATFSAQVTRKSPMTASANHAEDVGTPRWSRADAARSDPTVRKTA